MKTITYYRIGKVATPVEPLSKAKILSKLSVFPPKTKCGPHLVGHKFSGPELTTVYRAKRQPHLTVGEMMTLIENCSFDPPHVFHPKEPYEHSTIWRVHMSRTEIVYL